MADRTTPTEGEPYLAPEPPDEPNLANCCPPITAADHQRMIELLLPRRSETAVRGH